MKIDTRKYVPDGTRIVTIGDKVYLVFNPPWWRIDRWIRWLVVILLGRDRGMAQFSALVGPSGLGGLTSIEKFELRVYESDA